MRGISLQVVRVRPIPYLTMRPFSGSTTPTPLIAMKHWGPAGWTYLHCACLYASSVTDIQDLISAYARTLPCPTCRMHLQESILVLPVPLDPPQTGTPGAVPIVAPSSHETTTLSSHHPRHHPPVATKADILQPTHLAATEEAAQKKLMHQLIELQRQRRLFTWSVELHNRVNRSKNKPIYGLSQALKLYTGNSAYFNEVAAAYVKGSTSALSSSIAAAAMIEPDNQSNHLTALASTANKKGNSTQKRTAAETARRRAIVAMSVCLGIALVLAGTYAYTHGPRRMSGYQPQRVTRPGYSSGYSSLS